MFEGPEYASYLQLCRELRLEREFTDGDYYTAPVPVSVIAPEGFEVLIWADLYRLPRATEVCVWLPRLDQWLEMLEKAGIEAFVLDRIPPGDGVRMLGYPLGAYQSLDIPEWPATREEAAARLWCAVTGRVVTA